MDDFEFRPVVEDELKEFRRVLHYVFAEAPQPAEERRPGDNEPPEEAPEELDAALKPEWTHAAFHKGKIVASSGGLSVSDEDERAGRRRRWRNRRWHLPRLSPPRACAPPHHRPPASRARQWPAGSHPVGVDGAPSTSASATGAAARKPAIASILATSTSSSASAPKATRGFWTLTQHAPSSLTSIAASSTSATSCCTAAT